MNFKLWIFAFMFGSLTYSPSTGQQTVNAWEPPLTMIVTMARNKKWP
jgi:hypothetical protein